MLDLMATAKKKTKTNEPVRQAEIPFPLLSDARADPLREGMIMTEKHRFGLTGYPLPKNAQGPTCYDKSPGYGRIARCFRQLVADPGLGVLTGEAGVGKTAAIPNQSAALPKRDHLVLYFCDTTVAPLDLYRSLAVELGVKPSHRRGQLWTDTKKALLHMVDERGTAPVIILDEAQYLSDAFLFDLSAFLNF